MSPARCGRQSTPAGVHEIRTSAVWSEDGLVLLDPPVVQRVDVGLPPGQFLPAAGDHGEGLAGRGDHLCPEHRPSPRGGRSRKVGHGPDPIGPLAGGRCPVLHRVTIGQGRTPGGPQRPGNGGFPSGA